MIKPAWLCTLSLLAATVSLAATPIGDVVTQRDAYANQTVMIEGKVTSISLGYLADALYTLQGSDDFRITVVGKAPAPALGTALVVTGTVRRKPADEEFDFPPVVQETSRTAE
jgi:hypothetical protein